MQKGRSVLESGTIFRRRRAEARQSPSVIDRSASAPPIRRTLAIAWAFTWMMLRYGVLRLFVLVTADDDEVGLVERDHLRGRLLREALEGLGATCIKLAQVMRSRPDLFPRPVIEELESLQDDLPPFAGAHALIERELGGLASRFASIDDEPIAAASVAQVHHGVLEDGTEVAIKVLRPDVRKNAIQDGAVLVALARILMRMSEAAQHAELVLHLEHFLEGIVRQTDLRIEAENYTKFHANFANKKSRRIRVRFPKVFHELSSEHVLVMEFVRGEKVTRAAQVRFPDLAARLREAFLQMCFDDGFLHADMHPGNFVVESDGTICIFDVGLTKQLTDELLEHYIDFNRCLALGDVEDFMHHLRSYHRYIDGQVNWAALEQDVTTFSNEFRAMSAKDLEFRKLIDHLFDVGRRHGVRPVPDMTLMMVGLITAEGIGKQLDPEVNSFQEVSNYLIPVLARRNMLDDKTLAAAARLALRTAAV